MIVFNQRELVMKNDIEHKIEYVGDKIVVSCGGISCTMNKNKDDSYNEELINEFLDMHRRELFYNSQSFIDEFNEKLETAILATRGGGSGALACRDTLLSLYNGNTYKANLSSWYNLDSTNRAALLFVLEHQTANNRKDIDLYLPQYQADFRRMKNEVSDD